jgi:hypothetical protein
MHRYIEQLIEDFRRQRQLVTPPHEIWEGVDPEDPVEQDDISHVEQFVYGTKQPVSVITGIDRDLLPPPDKLTDEQAANLAVEMELLLNHFSLYPDFPESFPAHLRYPMLRELWDTKQVPLSFGENHIEFCSCDESNCPFPGYCTTCEDFRKEEASGTKADDLPDDFDVDDLLDFTPPWIDEP